MTTPAAPTDRDLDAAAVHVVYEWVALAEMTAELAKVTSVRTTVEHALLEAVLVHNRCLINFLCGDVNGRHGRRDIVPADFLGYEWWPDDDEDFDRLLRGRLPVLNKHLAHLSWERVTDATPVLWSVVLIGHQTHWGMKLFTVEAVKASSPQASLFDANRVRSEAAMPPLGKVAETRPVLAPERKKTP
jgi:hypothetical protein